jgi:uncharacterized protein YuzE
MITYDSEARILYIKLLELSGTRVAKTIPITDADVGGIGLSLDVSEDGKLVGIEVLLPDSISHEAGDILNKLPGPGPGPTLERTIVDELKDLMAEHPDLYEALNQEDQSLIKNGLSRLTPAEIKALIDNIDKDDMKISNAEEFLNKMHDAVAKKKRRGNH